MNVKHQEYFADSPSIGLDPASRDEWVLGWIYARSLNIINTRTDEVELEYNKWPARFSTPHLNKWDVWCSTVPMQPPIQSMVFEYSYTRNFELSKEIKQSNFTRYVGMLSWTRYFNLCKKLFFKLLLQLLVILNTRHGNIMWMINNNTMCLPWTTTIKYVIFYQS